MGVLNYFVGHWRRICLLIILILSFTIMFQIFAKVDLLSSETQVISFFGITLQNWGTILAILGTIFTLIWAMFQYDKNKILSQQEKASLVADELSGSLGEQIKIITMTLLENPQYSKIINDIKAKKRKKGLKTINGLKYFDVYEIKEIFELGGEKDTEKFLNESLKYITSDETQLNYRETLKKRYGDESTEQAKIKRKFPEKFDLLVELTLARLEFLCITISSNAAGTIFLYPSYHEDFLMLINLLSIFICSDNFDCIDKKYINIIEVYNLWNKIKEKYTAKVERKKNMIAFLKKVEEKIDKLMSRTSSSSGKI